MYPTVTKEGIIEPFIKVKLDYDSKYTQKLYKLGEEDTWKNYTTPINIYPGKQLQAKGIDDQGEESILMNYTAETLPSDSVTIEMYDKAYTTGYLTYDSSYTVYAVVDLNAIGKTIKMYYARHPWSDSIIEFLNENDEVVGTTKSIVETIDAEKENLYCKNVTIPEGTKRLRCLFVAGWMSGGQGFYELVIE